MSTVPVNTTEKKTAKPHRRLLLCVCGILLAAAAAVLLFFCSQNSAMPEMTLRGKTYSCGMPLEMTEELYVDLAENYDCIIGTRTVDGQELISSLSTRKPWPDSEPNRAAVIGGLRLGDPETKLLKKYPQAATDGLRITAGIYNPDETWEHFTVYFYEEKPYSPTEYEALLQSVSESEAEKIKLRSYALVVLTIQDEIDCIAFGDYTDLILPLTLGNRA